MAYRVAFQYPDGTLSSERIGLPMSLFDARVVARAAAGHRASGWMVGKYVVIDAKTEAVVE